MKSKLQTLSAISLLALAVVCIAVNFNVAYMGDTPQPVNITATVFYLLFWVLMLRLHPAAKTTAWMSIYSLVASVLGFCAIVGEWSGFASTLTTVMVWPVSALFYGIRFIPNFKLYYFVIAMFSFIVLIYSLITLVNKKPEQPKQKKEKKEQPKEEPLIAEVVEAEIVSQPEQQQPVQVELLPEPQEEYDVTARTAYETDSEG